MLAFVVIDYYFRYCNINDYPCVIYDHECTGNSEGDTRNVLFSHWVEDLETVITRLTEVDC